MDNDYNGCIVNIKTLKGLLGTITANGTAQLNVETVGNYTSIYDYKVNIK